MSSETAASSAASADSDNLRRSKRRKFRLDVVAAAHGNNQKRHRKDPHDEEEGEDDSQQLSVLTDMSAEVPVNDKEDEDYAADSTVSKRRQRRSTAHWGDYQDPFVAWVENTGDYACTSCPAKYESRSSLSNHQKMHNGEIRKYNCELCNFSSHTQKSLVLHNHVHMRYGVLSAQTSPVVQSTPNVDNPPSTSNNNIASSAPQLVAAAEEPFFMQDDDGEDMGSSGSPPPVLEREDSNESPPLLERQVSTTPTPSSRNSSVESFNESRQAATPVRKSNRSVKPPKKITPTHTPKKPKVSKRMRTDAKPRALTPQVSGSLSNSLTPSTSSSVTPPPKSSPPPAKREKLSKTTTTASEKAKSAVKSVPEAEKKVRKRRRCPHCPFTATSITRLNRHSGGHRLMEGFACPAKGCNYLCRTAGFLQRHYTVHKEKLPWPPAFVNRNKPNQKKAVKKIKPTIQLAQLKSHKKVNNGSEESAMRCNVGACQFQTVSLTQLVVHKTRAHQAQEVFQLHKFLCFTCGHRSKTYADLRVHKLTHHISTSRRFHRTFYLKEIVGDKFFIKHYTDQNEEPAEPEEIDESGDESFDSLPGTSGVPPETLAEIEKQAVFCCNMCPYQAPTMSRCQRHHAKHFTPSEFQCRHCSWSSKSQEVVLNHEKLHLPVGAEVQPSSSKKPEASNGSGETEETSREESLEMLKCPATKSLGESLKKWCKKEKAAFPAMEDQVIRIIVDGQKAFQCIDCPYTSKYRGDMRSHKKRHDIDQSFRCVHCTYTTNRPVSLKDHMKQHLSVSDSGRDVKPLKLIVNQGVHIGSRHGVGKGRVYRCHKCPYSTVSLGCLWRHSRNHRVTPKFYICSCCSYSSIDNRKMEEHLLIHLAMGPPSEQTPFVKRVDTRGNPVNSLTDLNSKEERKAVKRKLAAAAAAAAAAASCTVAASSGEKIEKEEKPKPEKRPRKGSKESNSSSESPPPQPTRQLSERTTRSSNNYQFMTRHFKALQAPSKDEILEMEKIVDIKLAQPMSRSHYKVRETLGMVGEKEPRRCPECPFKSVDEVAFARHARFHEVVESPRPYQCSDCTFGAFTPSAILAHVRLHDDGIEPDTVHRRAATKSKKGDMMSAGTATYSCKTCSFRTGSHRSFTEHMAQHRFAFINRVQMNMKRQAPKEEYQRPKHKHQPVVRNAKYCKFCTFKTTSANTYVEHLDRHGCEALFKCHLCNYSDKNKSTVEFHQLNHHIMRDASVHTVHGAMKYRLESGVIQKPAFEAQKPTAQEMAMKVRSLLRCRSCEFFCHGPQELAFHMSVNHASEPGAREMISLLSQGLRPENTEITEVCHE